MEYCHICGSTWDTAVFIRCPYCEHEEYLKSLEEEDKEEDQEKNIRDD